MAVHHAHTPRMPRRLTARLHRLTAQPTDRAAAGTATTATAIAQAAARVSLGFVFLWAFLDKTFGLGYATTSAAAWVKGGSPTKGFLSHVSAGPFQSAFHQ